MYKNFVGTYKESFEILMCYTVDRKSTGYSAVTTRIKFCISVILSNVTDLILDSCDFPLFDILIL